MFAINHCTVTPVRQEPSEGSEQLTQLLFGEVCEVLDRLPRWTKIRSTLDGQEGWVDFKMVSLASSLSASAPHRLEAVVAAPMAAATPMDGGADLLLTLGTRLPNYSHGTFEVLGQQYLIDPTCVNNTTQLLNSDLSRAELLNNVCATAQTLLNTPYLWGGKNAMGLDCSGFTQVVYAAVGVNLLRNAREQITQGEEVKLLSEALPGDLAFFGYTNSETQAIKITHVGLLLSPTEIIHCAGGRVHIDRIDADGIYLLDGTKTHDLIQIKRYL